MVVSTFTFTFMRANEIVDLAGEQTWRRRGRACGSTHGRAHGLNGLNGLNGLDLPVAERLGGCYSSVGVEAEHALDQV